MNRPKELPHRHRLQAFSFSAISPVAHYLETVNIMFIGEVLPTNLALLR